MSQASRLAVELRVLADWFHGECKGLNGCVPSEKTCREAVEVMQKISARTHCDDCAHRSDCTMQCLDKAE